MSKHTPGPWSYLPRHICESEPEVRAPDGWLICCTASDDDARLIAAAPRILDVLQEILDYRGGADSALDDEYVMDRARAAIAQATGDDKE